MELCIADELGSGKPESHTHQPSLRITREQESERTRPRTCQLIARCFAESHRRQLQKPRPHSEALGLGIRVGTMLCKPYMSRSAKLFQGPKYTSLEGLYCCGVVLCQLHTYMSTFVPPDFRGYSNMREA